MVDLRKSCYNYTNVMQETLFFKKKKLIHLQLSYNSNNFFLRSTIEYLGLTCRKTDSMVNLKKKLLEH
jgi:hypothetical protein